LSTPSKSIESVQLLIGEPERRGESKSGVVMDNVSEAPLKVADGAGADAGALCQLLLRHPGRQAQLLERGAKCVVHPWFHRQPLRAALM
jgi:hypothetical protein